MEWVEEENRKTILKELNTEDLTFGELLEKRIVSRTALSTHLSKLLESGDVKKAYDSQKKKVVYQISSKSVTQLQIEGMIKRLGRVATHQVIRKKLNLPIEFDVYKEAEEYMKEQPRSVSWKELFDFLEEKYPVTI